VPQVLLGTSFYCVTWVSFLRRQYISFTVSSNPLSHRTTSKIRVAFIGKCEYFRWVENYITQSIKFIKINNVWSVWNRIKTTCEEIFK